jgi:hypothetical protein
VHVRAGATTIARSRYRCVANRATTRLRLSKRLAGGRTPATAVVREHRRTSRLSLELSTRTAAPPRFWTDGHLQCGAPAYLVEPDFTAATPIPVSTRGWIAWYTGRGGWQWLGDRRWTTWTATPTGIAQFHPDGAVQPTPYTAGPITIPPVQGIRAVGVFEIVY